MPLRRSAAPQRRAPLKRRAAPVRKTAVNEKRLRPRRGPERNPDYLAWIRTLPCVICGRHAGPVLIEAAHANALGNRGLGLVSRGPDGTRCPCTEIFDFRTCLFSKTYIAGFAKR